MDKEIIQEVKAFLDEKANEYNTPDFIDLDPISIPHKYSRKEDIEISGFLAATISWGNRKMILRNANKMMNLMGNSPYDFIMEHKDYHLEHFDGFVHRTFNADDLRFFITSLQNIYKNHGGIESVFNKHKTETSLQPAIHEFKKVFFSIKHQQRTQKHIGDPYKGSVAKRINMMLRWFIRNDNRGVDFGIWKSISPSILSCPLDAHSGNIARKLGLITRKNNDVKALSELDAYLRVFDCKDPVKYDFALFGLGVYDEFKVDWNN